MAATQERQEPLGPVKLCGSLHETIWGGQRLREIAGKNLPDGKRVGESWETALDSVVMTAPHDGKSLEQLVGEYGEAFLGKRAVEVYGKRFPLLAKFIDANDWLSVQVHPNDSYAAEHEGGKLGKTEAWYILAAEPGAQIVYGLTRQSSRDEVRSAIASNSLESLMLTVEVRTGDVIFVPAGTVHAIGSGVTLYELQEYSDVTYRLYDYGRLQANGKPRELHVERALDVIRYSPSPLERVMPMPAPDGASDREAERMILVACRYFVLEQLTLDGAWSEPETPGSCRIVTALSGAVDVSAEGFAPLRLQHGETTVLPANLSGVRLNGAGAVVRAYVPEEDDRGLALWREAHDAVFSEK